jgi:hypothetical protein
VVVFPQAPELSTGRPQTAKNRGQGHPQEIHQPLVDQNPLFHTSTTPYYDYYVFNENQ